MKNIFDDVEDIDSWIDQRFIHTSQKDLLGSKCPCGSCHVQQMARFRALIRHIPKVNIKKRLATAIDTQRHEKKLAYHPVETATILLRWIDGKDVEQFIKDYPDDVDVLVRDFIKGVDADLRDKFLGDCHRAGMLGYGGELKERLKRMGLSERSIKEYVAYCFENNFVPWATKHLQHSVSPKPQIDYKDTFESRWNLFIRKKQYIDSYFDVRNDGEKLQKAILSSPACAELLELFPNKVSWKRLKKQLLKKMM